MNIKIWISLFIGLVFCNYCLAQDVKHKNARDSEIRLKEGDHSLKEVLKTIGINDQKYRQHSAIDWEKQNILDSLNRVSLDSLYIESGFPKIEHVGKEGILSIVLVSHHSSDCEWNEKWLIILLENQKELIEHINLVKFMIQRTYSKDSGICLMSESIKDQLAKDRFAELLKKYNIDLASY